MAENYKHLYHQTKIMLEKYQDEIVPGLREQLEKRVEVVRCKDCCHAVVARNKGVVMYIRCGYFPNTILSKDFYCANGREKMDGGQPE